MNPTKLARNTITARKSCRREDCLHRGGVPKTFTDTTPKFLSNLASKEHSQYHFVTVFCIKLVLPGIFPKIPGKTLYRGFSKKSPVKKIPGKNPL